MRDLLLSLCLCFAVAAAYAGNGTDYASFVEALRADRIDVKAEGAVEQPFFSARGKVISVYDDLVQVFEYRNAAMAEKDAAAVSADGRTVGKTKPHWIGPPHFFKKDRLIVLYLGDNQKLLKALQARLGPQFAGD
jgi:hypothetical protein